MKKVTWLAAAAVVLALGARPAHAQTLTCESRDGMRAFCNAGNVAGVSLRRQLSSAPCVRGRTWGFTRNAVWVSGGCRAQFDVLQGNTGYGSGNYGDPRYDRYGNRRRDTYGGGAEYTTSWNGDGAAAACSKAVRAYLGHGGIDAELVNNSRNNPLVAWRSGNLYGTCHLSRQNGSLAVNVQGQR